MMLLNCTLIWCLLLQIAIVIPSFLSFPFSIQIFLAHGFIFDTHFCLLYSVLEILVLLTIVLRSFIIFYSSIVSNNSCVSVLFTTYTYMAKNLAIAASLKINSFVTLFSK